MLRIGCVFGVVPGSKSGGELGDDGCEVAEEGDRVRLVTAQFFGRDVDMDELRIATPFRRIAEVEDPIQTRAKDEDNVGFFQGGAAGAGSVGGMRVGEDAFAHGGGEKGEVCAIDEVSYVVFRFGVGGAFADDDEGGIGGFKHLDDFEEDCLFRSAFGAFWYWRYGWDIGGVLNGALDDVGWQVNEACARSAIP